MRTRDVSLFTIVLSLVVASVVSALAQAPAAGWAQFRGNPRLTGVAATAPSAVPMLRWTYEAADAIESSPAIVDSVVYVTSANGDLLALDLASGKLRWKYASGGSTGESSPTASASAVFFGDLGGKVHAVNIRDGSPLWTFTTGSEVKSSPVLANDLLLVGSYDTHLYALDSRTGKLRWKLQTTGPPQAPSAGPT